ncbi:hypothetical protein NC651_010270 [Populus alba x Populus x berolinensis]|nr:hypothetical protein NC651_010270 [Populus alba x Populus x berolinensis]
MVENSSNGAIYMVSATARIDDSTWVHGQVVVGAKTSRINGGGITRLKYHRAGIKSYVEACKKVSPEVQCKMLGEDLTIRKET